MASVPKRNWILSVSYEMGGEVVRGPREVGRFWTERGANREAYRLECSPSVLARAMRSMAEDGCGVWPVLNVCRDGD